MPEPPAGAQMGPAECAAALRDLLDAVIEVAEAMLGVPAEVPRCPR